MLLFKHGSTASGRGEGGCQGCHRFPAVRRAARARSPPATPSDAPRLGVHGDLLPQEDAHDAQDLAVPVVPNVPRARLGVAPTRAPRPSPAGFAGFGRGVGKGAVGAPESVGVDVPDGLGAGVVKEAEGEVMVLQELAEDDGKHNLEGMATVKKGLVHVQCPPDVFDLAETGRFLNLLADLRPFVLRSTSADLGRLERVLRCGPVETIVAHAAGVVLTQIRV
jgi:hypothetical protein